MRAIAKTYGIKENSQVNEIVSSILKAGLTTIAGRTLLNQLKLIPALSVAGSVLNAITAGIITFAAGQISITMFERVYKGDAEYKTVDWEAEAASLFRDYMPGIVKIVQKYAEENNGSIDPRQIGSMLTDFFNRK